MAKTTREHTSVNDNLETTPISVHVETLNRVEREHQITTLGLARNVAMPSMVHREVPCVLPYN